jgi:hypothetical protein
LKPSSPINLMGGGLRLLAKLYGQACGCWKNVKPGCKRSDSALQDGGNGGFADYSLQGFLQDLDQKPDN